MKEFFQEVSSHIGFNRPDLVEKDFRLHTLLKFISESDHFAGRYLFKGGTCLTKGYLGYYRLSEDIDLTYVEDGLFDMSQTQLRKKLGKRIDELVDIMNVFSIDYGYNFKPLKNDDRYVQHGGSNKFVTFKLHYTGDVTGIPSFVKVQINFLEEILFQSGVSELRSLSSEIKDKSVRVAFPKEYELYSSPIRMEIYNIQEIFCEKVRAILTRRGIKARDFVDLFKLNATHGFTLKGSRQPIIRKTLFMIEKYEKYKENLDGKIDLLSELGSYNWTYERGLLIEKINEEDIFEYVSGILPDLEDITEEVKGRIK